ncbi:MAG: M13 family metallopeptidase [Bacteroidales bacterium]|nr:M13 family metallopeptidase [Bacteroidales bacterium]
MKRIIMMLLPIAILASCGTKTEKTPAIDLANLDTTVSPAVDFYQYATGGWQKNNPLGPEYSRYGAFNVLDDLSQERLNTLFQSMATMNPAKGTDEQKIVDLYKMGLDSLKLNADGCTPIAADLAAIYAVSNKTELAKMIAEMHNAGVGAFFSGGVSADLTDSNNQILYISQGGLGIGNRDYYTEAENAAIKAGYKAYLEKVFALTGCEDAAKAASNALAVEDALALASWTRTQTRDVEASYNPTSSAELAKTYAGFDFNTYFETRGIPAQDKLVVEQPSFFAGLSKYLATANLDVVKDYLAGQLITDACSALSDDFQQASFDFFSKQLTGAQEMKPRWKRAMSVPNRILGQAVGKMYVERWFPESSKEKMLTLVKNIQTALGEHIANLTWMSDETKARAQEKLSSFIVKIGYPDVWEDYSTLTIDPEKSYYENLKAASIWAVADNLSDLGKPVDRTEWGMTPQTVNAYYNPTTNEICFPAGILQPPFFNADADDAVNYGAIGVVICHEMTHGFDDQGRLFDKEGNMTNWWTDADDQQFRALADVLVKQFDEIEVLPGMKANGTLTLGENIADHGGLSVAFSAMQNTWNGNKPAPIDGFTPEQRFFLGYAQVWAQNITDAEIARRTNQDEHSLANNRVNVSVRNFQNFFDAFGIKEGDPMYRPESERVSIW